MKKLTRDCSLEKLDESQQARLKEWMLALLLHEVRELASAEEPEGLGIQLSLCALREFANKYLPQHLLDKRERSAQMAACLAREAALKPGEFEQAARAATLQRLFELAINPCSKAVDLRAIAQVLLKFNEQALEEKKLRLLEEKNRTEEEAAEQKAKTALSPEEQERRIKEIFGADA